MTRVTPSGLLLLLAAVTACSSATARPHRHGHGHRFQDPDRWSRVFDGPERDRWQKPDAVIALLGVTPTMKVAEIGAGTGYFIVRLARRVPRGRAFGIDIEEGMVAHLARRARKEKLPQLVSRLGAPDDPRIPEPVDLVFLCNTYHHIEERPAYFRRLQGSLQPGGRLAIVDFKKKKTPMGPPAEMRLSPRQVDRELTAAGYKRIALDLKTLPYQYVAIYAPAE